MKIRKTIVIFLAMMCLLAGSAFATSERSVTSPANSDFWSNPYAGWGDSSATPELGDSSVVSTAAVAGLCVATLAGVAIADKKRRNLSK